MTNDKLRLLVIYFSLLTLLVELLKVAHFIENCRCGDDRRGFGAQRAWPERHSYHIIPQRGLKLAGAEAAFGAAEERDGEGVRG